MIDTIADIKFDIREWNEWIKRRYPNKDMISLSDLLNDYEDAILEIEELEDKIKSLEQDEENTDICEKDYTCLFD